MPSTDGIGYSTFDELQNAVSQTWIANFCVLFKWKYIIATIEHDNVQKSENEHPKMNPERHDQVLDWNEQDCQSLIIRRLSTTTPKAPYVHGSCVLNGEKHVKRALAYTKIYEITTTCTRQLKYDICKLIYSRETLN